jgi:predicted nucleotidyltransferase
MLKKVEKFLEKREVSKDIYENIGFLCEAGSNIFGTNNKDSDIDLRGIVIPQEDYIIGLKEFKHLKKAEGEGSINLSEDLDIELYSLKNFILEAYEGHCIPFEMLFLPDGKIIHQDDRLNKLFNEKDIFLSKKFIKHYLAMNKQFEYKIEITAEKLKNPLSINRVVQFGFETKNASKAIQHFYLLNEFFDTNQVTFYRKEREHLLNIKEGRVSLDLIKQEIKELRNEVEDKLKMSKMQEKPKFEDVNKLYKDIISELI